LSYTSPGRFELSYLPSKKIEREYISVTYQGLRMWSRLFRTPDHLIKWFKEHFKERPRRKHEAQERQRRSAATHSTSVSVSGSDANQNDWVQPLSGTSQAEKEINDSWRQVTMPQANERDQPSLYQSYHSVAPPNNQGNDWDNSNRPNDDRGSEQAPGIDWDNSNRLNNDWVNNNPGNDNRRNDEWSNTGSEWNTSTQWDNNNTVWNERDTTSNQDNSEYRSSFTHKSIEDRPRGGRDFRSRGDRGGRGRRGGRGGGDDRRSRDNFSRERRDGSRRGRDFNRGRRDGPAQNQDIVLDWGSGSWDSGSGDNTDTRNSSQPTNQTDDAW